MARFIFVTGGVVSGLGKGITAASLGRLLKARGLKIASQKFDPYMNIDPGTLSPIQHGEVFVTEDGAEADLDLGHYERFIDEDLNKYSDLTSGQIYWSVLEKERRGEYLGETVQIIPHVTNEIKNLIRKAAKVSQADVLITEIGGTVGDIEGQPFLEAIRQFSIEVGRHNCLFVHVTLVPFLAASGEHKSKPTQHSVKELRSLGLVPDVIVARVEEPMDDDLRRKIAMFCDVRPDCVIENQTASCLYEVPLMLHKEGLDRVACRALRLRTPDPDLEAWMEMVHRIRAVHRGVRIAIIGKYIRLHDAYLSVSEALSHAGYACGTSVEILWVDSEDITAENADGILKDCAGILIPGGLDEQGIEGMIAAAHVARARNIPYLGLCLGLYTAVMDFARTEGLPQAEQLFADRDMRRGAHPMQIKEGTALHTIYGETLVHERHRHRHELDGQFKETLEKAGLTVSGMSPDGSLIEAVELSEHAFFIGMQSHPEFKSRPNRAHPLFTAFVGAILRETERRSAGN